MPGSDLGDLLRAAEALGVTDEAGWWRVAASFGLVPGAVATGSGRPVRPVTRRPAGGASVVAPPAPVATPGRTPAAGALVVLDPVAPTADWRTGVALLDDETGSTTPLVPEPLFVRPRDRGQLLATAGTPTPTGDVDVPRLVRVLASLRALERLPQERRVRLSRGVQVLVDRGAGMDPFRHDVDDVLRRLREVAGAHRVEVASFVGCPSRGLGRAQRTWRPPPPAVAVLVVSDLDADPYEAEEDPSTTAEWLLFARRRPIVALCPARVGRTLAAAIRVVPWDRRTSARRARRGIR
jgi:hypothetical protein